MIEVSLKSKGKEHTKLFFRPFENKSDFGSSGGAASLVQLKSTFSKTASPFHEWIEEEETVGATFRGSPHQ